MPRPADAAVTRYRGFLRVGDPLADAVAAAMDRGAVDWGGVEAGLGGAPVADDALRAFLGVAERWPLWADPARLVVGSEALQRTHVLGGLVLALYSLPLGYLSSAGVKPLVLSGRFVEQAPRRLAETNRFLHAVSAPGGLGPGAEGLHHCLRVRLVHARVRLRLRRSPAWRPESWGEPINQAHLAGTNLMFSLHCVDGLQRLGVRFSDAEIDGILHRWRLIGHLLGIDDELLAGGEADARRLWAIIRAAEPPPDEDCRRLTRALVGQAVPATLGSLLPPALRSDPLLVPLLFRLSTALLGREQAALLGLPPQQGPLLIAPLVRALVGGVEALRGDSPRARRLLVQLGSQVNARLAEAALDGRPLKLDEVG